MLVGFIENGGVSGRRVGAFRKMPRNYNKRIHRASTPKASLTRLGNNERKKRWHFDGELIFESKGIYKVFILNGPQKSVQRLETTH